jgi:dihydrofolate reductase
MAEIERKNIVYIATSLDGYIADKKGNLDWLEIIPNPDDNNFGFSEFMKNIDALVMGRNTYETVLDFDIPWPYTKPVFVLSNTLDNIPDDLKGKVELAKGSIKEVLKVIYVKGYTRLYIDGGKVIKGFLKEDLIDEMIITQIPILLGGGISLFGSLEKRMVFEHIKTEVLLNAIVKSHYQRKR